MFYSRIVVGISGFIHESLKGHDELIPLGLGQLYPRSAQAIVQSLHPQLHTFDVDPRRSVDQILHHRANVVLEGWSWVDSFYFTVVTLTTVGYGDLAPSGDISKLFTVFLIVAGVGFILAFLNFLASMTVNTKIGQDED
ncbi:hypothetical protein BH23ACT4_BH23ACT4_07370 [soil metagenome]